MSGHGPILILPFNDPSGLVWRSFEPVIPALKQVFERVLVGIPGDAAEARHEYRHILKQERFFDVLETPAGQMAGEYFCAIYQDAAVRYPAGALLHLAFPDRVAFAAGGAYRVAFLDDMRTAEGGPVIYARSQRAWETHPENYRQVEKMISDAGELLFARQIDFAWCHLALSAGRLGQILPRCTRRDMSFLAELVVALLDDVQMRAVDWLAWEDPFILGRDAAALKTERENSLAESRRRLGYALPMMDVLLQSAAGRP